MTHYVFLAAFIWMSIEGIHLYKMVVYVFDSGRSHTTIYRIVSYGIPVIIVGITCAVGNLLGDHPYGKTKTITINLLSTFVLNDIIRIYIQQKWLFQ